MKIVNSEINASRDATIHTWIADDASEITADFCPDAGIGSMVIVIATKDIYIKNCAGKWQKFGTSEVI